MNLDTPEGRYAATQALGHDGYNKAMAEHAKASTVATVNGYGLRWVSSRFGRLCSVVESPDKMAFTTIEAATAHANSLPTYRAPPDRTYAARNVSEREDAFLIAAIRLWQSVQTGSIAIIQADGNPCGLDGYDDMLTSGGRIAPITPVEIDDVAVEVFGLDPWFSEEERAALAPKEIGKSYRFNYPNFGTPDGYPDYTAHRGATVTVKRQLTDDECDSECQPMYEIEAADGWIGCADGSELGSL